MLGEAVKCDDCEGITFFERDFVSTYMGRSTVMEENIIVIHFPQEGARYYCSINCASNATWYRAKQAAK